MRERIFTKCDYKLAIKCKIIHFRVLLWIKITWYILEVFTIA